MESYIQSLLTELYEAGQANDAREQERSKKMLNLECWRSEPRTAIARSG